MYQKIVNRYSKHCYYALTLVFLTVIGLLWTDPVSAASQYVETKVIVYVVDDLDLQDLNNKKLMNFQKAIDSGALGLMNTRSGNLAIDNRSSAYLTIGMGIRVVFPDNPPAVMNKEPLANTGVSGKDTDKNGLYNVVIKNTEVLTNTISLYRSKNKQNLGDVARKNRKIIGLIVNADSADTNSHISYASLMAVNSSGQIGIGNVGSPLGQITDLCRRAIGLTDILFIEFEDMSRIADSREKSKSQAVTLSALRQRALRRADALLGNLMKISDSEKAVLIIISPMSKNDRQVTAFKNLAPLIMYGNGVGHGILTSNTTRRAGLVSNIDISPTILKLTGINPKNYGYLGETLQVISLVNNIETVRGNLDRLIHLKTSRYIIHGVYFLLLVIFSFITLDFVRKGRLTVHQRTLRAVALMVIAVPAFSLIIPSGFHDDSIYLDIVLTITAIVLVGVIGSKNLNRTLDGMAAVSIITVLFMIIDLTLGRGSILNTPLGFNDVFSGGRYYGLNNDCMGILLGSSVFSSFYISERLGFSRIKTLFAAAILLTVASLSLMPEFGANVGGTIAALTTGMVAAILLISKKGVNSARFIGTVIIVIAFELIISYIDSLSGSQTHAGKALNALMSGNTAITMIEIIKSKLMVFGTMLLIPPWNILLFMQVLGCYILYKKHFNKLLTLKFERPLLSTSFKVTYYGAIVALIFNDTGVIATALMLTYITMPLGVLVANNYNLGEYRSDLSQKI